MNASFLISNMRGLFKLDKLSTDRVVALRDDLLRRLPLAANPLNRRDSQALVDACNAVLAERANSA